MMVLSTIISNGFIVLMSSRSITYSRRFPPGATLFLLLSCVDSIQGTVLLKRAIAERMTWSWRTVATITRVTIGMICSPLGARNVQTPPQLLGDVCSKLWHGVHNVFP